MQGISGQDLPFYKVKDVSVAWHAQSVRLLKTEHSLSYQDAERIKAKPVPEGTVVFAKIGEALRLNRRAIVPRPSLIDNNLMGIDAPSTRLADRYLFWFTLATKFDVDARASVVPSIRKSDVGNISFPLPPLAEQTRIVSKLEELLSELDAGVAELKAAQKKLKQYRQSLLKAAVDGSLTAAWRARPENQTPTETGAQLLARILQERRTRWEAQQLAKFEAQGKVPPKGWQGKYVEPVAPSTAGLPELPAGWVWANVDQLSPNDLANGRSVPSAEVGARVLRLTSVKKGRIDLAEFKCGNWSEDEARQFAVVTGDLLIVRGNGSLSLVGRAGLVGQVSEQVAYPDTLIRLRVVENVVSSAWIGLVWSSPIVRAHLERRARTSAGIYKISQPDIVSCMIPVPPLAEQAEILASMDRYDDDVRAVEATLELAHRQSAAQRQNLLRAAFSGQLVPQDPADEPAGVLLARIRAEREGAHAGRKPAAGVRAQPRRKVLKESA
jgi:type I restriction enzyme, S subunit